MELHFTGSWESIKKELAEMLGREETPVKAEAESSHHPLPTPEAVFGQPPGGGAPPPFYPPGGGAPPLKVPAPVTTNQLLDKMGTPWDLRIHATTKTFMKDGSWKKLRGVDSILVTQVMAEIGSTPGAGEVTGATGAGEGGGVDVTTPSTMADFVTYGTKVVNATSPGDWQGLMGFLAQLNPPVVNVAEVSPERFPELAEAVRAQFNVEF